MVDLTDQINGVTLETATVRQLLDSPANSFLTDAAVEKVLVRSYNWVIGKIDTDDHSGQSIADAIYAFSVWQLYMVYTESISEYITEQSPSVVMKRVDDFRKAAVIYLEAIGIAWPLDKDGVLDVKNIKAINAKYGYSGVAGIATMTEVYRESVI